MMIKIVFIVYCGIMGLVLAQEDAFFLSKGNSSLIRIGSTAIFNCSINLNPRKERFFIKWYFRGHPLESFERSPRQRYSNRKTIMKLNKVKPRDSGEYWCIVQVDEKRYMKAFEIPPKKKPYIYKLKDSQQVAKKDREIRLKCLVSPKFTTSYKWYFQGQELRPRPGYSDFKVKKYSFLTIYQATVKDNGIYTCSVANKFGRSEATYYVNVKGNADPSLDLAPKIKRNSTVNAELLMNTLRLDCLSTGELPFTVKWFKNGKPLSEMPRKNGKLYLFEHERQVLVLKNLLPSDRGKFTCDVRNKYGGFSHTMLVDPIESAPNQPVFVDKGDSDQYHIYHAAIGENVTVSTGVALFGTAHFQMLQHVHKFDNKTNTTHLKLEVIHVPRRSRIIALKKGGPAEEYLIDFFFINVTESTYGNYTIMAGNTMGYDIYPFGIVPKPMTKIVAEKDTHVKDAGNNATVIILVTASVLFFLLILIVLAIFKCVKKKKKGENNNSIMSKKELETVILNIDSKKPLSRVSTSSARHTSSRLSSCQTEKDYFIIPYDEKWEVDFDNIELRQPLGEGAFGRVMLANAYGLPGCDEMKTVAVKMLKEHPTEQELKDLVSEISVMKTFGKHLNVINLMGVSSRSGELCLIMEYCRHGNLRSFLKQRRPVVFPQLVEYEELTLVDLVSFCLQVAKGMNYLASQKCIHRDIAARNVLVADDYVMKIADFGLARDVHERDYYRKFTDGRLPVKWMAMEALFDRVYTVQSDVWSYGILAWEIITFGGSPYPGVPLEKLFDLLKQGYRMEKPINCTDEIYDLMLHCWKENPLSRPTFGEIIDRLEEMMIQLANSDYLQLQPPIYYNGARESNSSSTPSSPPASPLCKRLSGASLSTCVFEDSEKPAEEESRLLSNENDIVTTSGSYSNLHLKT